MPFPIIPALAVGLSALGIGASMFSSKQTNKSNLNAVRETNQANLDIARETNQANALINQQSLDAQMRMQQQAQNYNSPITQASMLRQAGLNPALNDSMAASIGASSVPSPIPMQGANMQPALNNYSDTYIDKGLQAAAQAIESFDKANSGYGVFIDNQTKHEMNVTELSKRYAEIENILQSSKVSRAERKRLQAEMENIKLTTDIMRNSQSDIQYSYAAQNQLTEANARLAIEKINESQEAVLTSRLARQLSLQANSRAERELQATVSKLYAEAYAANQQGRLSEKEIDSYANKYANQLLQNELLSDEIKHNKVYYQQVRDQMKQEIRQAQQDYWNIFRYVGSFFGGAGAAATRIFLK